MTRAVTVTLNPALDITTSVERLVSGRKLRCRAPRIDAGGGGVNVSRAIAKLGETSLAMLALGGPIGEKMRRLLQEEGKPATELCTKEGTEACFKAVVCNRL